MEDSRRPTRMVDVSGKEITTRVAIASGSLYLSPTVLDRIRTGNLEKGDALEAARIAGILAVKRTPEILPLCHPVRVSSVKIDFDLAGENKIGIRARVKGEDRTGVEMEALTAVAVAGLTIYDVCKIHDPRMTLSEITLEEKTGGRSGHYRRES